MPHLTAHIPSRLWLIAVALLSLGGCRMIDQRTFESSAVSPAPADLKRADLPALPLLTDSWAAPSLLWHFAGMWLLAVNGLCYVVYGFVTGRLRKRMLPITFAELVQTVRDTLHFKIEHDDLTVYNAVQKLLYIVVILAAISQVVTGILIWKPIQFSAAVALLGGFQSVRLEHFLGMSVIVGFLIVHVALSLLVPQTLWAMLSGGPRLAEEKLS